MATTTRPRRSKSAKAKSVSQEPARVGPDGRPYRPDVSLVEACSSTCNATLAYCLTQSGEQVDEHFLKSLMDATELCSLTAALVSRGSTHGEQLMAVCAEACRDVASACGQFPEDVHMRACLQAARQAEEWCRR